jgi:hypothetical protein
MKIKLALLGISTALVAIGASVIYKVKKSQT